MVTKAIIKEKINNKFTVRIPLFESAGNNNEVVFTATLCYQPGNLEAYNVGDVVFVAFENSEISKPVIVGKLYLGEEKNPRGQIQTSSIEILAEAKLPANTSLGNVSAEDVYSAIRNDKITQDRLNQLEKKLNDLINNN